MVACIIFLLDKLVQISPKSRAYLGRSLRKTAERKNDQSLKQQAGPQAGLRIAGLENSGSTLGLGNIIGRRWF